MAEYMGTHNSDGAMADKDLGAMMLPHTSLSEANNILSPSSEGPPGLTSPSYLGRVSSANDYVGQSPQDSFLSHSALTGLAAAAAHHARFSSAGQSPGSSSNPMPGLSSPGQAQSATPTPQMSPAFNGGAAVETSDLGSGGATLSISYMRQGDNYVCSLCGKTVASKAAITRHIQLTHEKKKPFECNICHRRFGYKNILLEHQNIHFGIKPYSCNLCDKRFAARSNLFQHRLLHMKPYHCEVRWWPWCRSVCEFVVVWVCVCEGGRGVGVWILCVCVYSCVWERERERERERQGETLSIECIIYFSKIVESFFSVYLFIHIYLADLRKL